MKVVSPYRPFPPESPAHRKLGAFDWTDALVRLRVSVARACDCPMLAITDVDTDLPVPAHRYVTHERELMLWILEVCLRYLDSPDFDQDTVMLSPDTLVFQDLRPWFLADLGVVVRFAPKYAARPLLNGAQWWRHAAQDRLVRLYGEALALARTLPANCRRWGADTEALVTLLAPFVSGIVHRHALTVYCLSARTVMNGIGAADMQRLDRHKSVPWPTTPIVDFKYLRKRYLAAYYAATVGAR